MAQKTYEVRVNDRDFVYGDKVTLREWKQEEPRGYTGLELVFKIGYVLDIKGGVCVFSLLKWVDNKKHNEEQKRKNEAGL